MKDWIRRMLLVMMVIILAAGTAWAEEDDDSDYEWDYDKYIAFWSKAAIIWSVHLCVAWV